MLLGRSQRDARKWPSSGAELPLGATTCTWMDGPRERLRTAVHIQNNVSGQNVDFEYE